MGSEAYWLFTTLHFFVLFICWKCELALPHVLLDLHCVFLPVRCKKSIHASKADLLQSTIMDKSLWTLLHFWDVFQFTQVQPLPSLHKQCWTCVSRIFSRVSALYTVTCFMREPRNDRKIWILQYTVPRTFVHDCSWAELLLSYQLLNLALFFDTGIYPHESRFG